MNMMGNPGIDPGTSHMLSERSTIWASPPLNTLRTVNFANCAHISVADQFREMQNRTKPDEGLEPATLRLKVWCSTDWANRAYSSYKAFSMADV